MKNIIKAEVYFDEEYYCGKCFDFDIFTQGKTLDELINNLKEAIQVHFEDNPEGLENFSPTPSPFTMMDLDDCTLCVITDYPFPDN